jgi:hypothetical protein
MKNELGMLKNLRSDIQSGYGLHQMLKKEQLEEDELLHLCVKYPDFGNEITKRFGYIAKTPERVATPKEVKELSDIKKKAKELKIKAWNLKSDETLAKEIEQLS